LDTKFAIGSNQDLPAGHSYARDAGDERRVLRALRAEADRGGLACFPFIANLNIVITAGKILSGQLAHSDVAVARRVNQCEMAECGVTRSGDRVRKRGITKGGIRTAGRVLRQCKETGGSIAISAVVLEERVVSLCIVAEPGGIIHQRLETNRRAGIAIVIG